MDESQQNAIYRKYGDYLYQKGNYDEAMAQYIKAIDSTEPSRVIRKFLDTQRIHNLIEYLEELHDHHKATADHTTLLLNCYAKLKDLDKLEKFIKSPGDLKFDLDTAIAMCRQGGYYEQAAYLAQQHGETELVVDILIEDSKKYGDALDYIWRQAPDVVRAALFFCFDFSARSRLFPSFHRSPQTLPAFFSSTNPLLGTHGDGLFDQIPLHLSLGFLIPS